MNQDFVDTLNLIPPLTSSARKVRAAIEEVGNRGITPNPVTYEGGGAVGRVALAMGLLATPDGRRTSDDQHLPIGIRQLMAKAAFVNGESYPWYVSREASEL